MPTKLYFLISALFILCLLPATPALAIPTCEIDCNANTPCTQICWHLNSASYSTCAIHICDEPQFPWLTTTWIRDDAATGGDVSSHATSENHESDAEPISRVAQGEGS